MILVNLFMQKYLKSNRDIGTKLKTITTKVLLILYLNLFES